MGVGEPESVKICIFGEFEQKRQRGWGRTLRIKCDFVGNQVRGRKSYQLGVLYDGVVMRNP